MRCTHVGCSRYIPTSSANPLLDSISKNRERFILFNKTDLADPEANKVDGREGLFLFIRSFERWENNNGLEGFIC